MHKRKREQIIEEEESKIKRKDKEEINILKDSLINVTNEMDKLKAKVNGIYSTINGQNSTINEHNSKINILESQRQKDQIIIAELSDFVFHAKLSKILKKIGTKKRRWVFYKCSKGNKYKWYFKLTII